MKGYLINMSAKLYLALLLVATTSLFSCDRIFIKAEPPAALITSSCSPPCWQNIVPGQTSKQEVDALVSAIPGINVQKSKWIGPWNIYSDRYYVEFDNRNSEGEIYIIDGIVDSIGIFGDINLNVDWARTHFGEPSSLVLEKKSTGDIIFLQIGLLYPESGLLLIFDDGDLETAHIRPDRELKMVIFVDPAQYESTLSEHLSLIDPEALQFNHYSWLGYGDIKFEPGE